jgi:transcriptional/translational regulatory protein YebC/TACO1
MFNKKGYIVVEKSKAVKALLGAVLGAGADDMRTTTTIGSAERAGSVQAVRDAVRARHRAASAQVSIWNLVMLEGKVAQQMLKLMEALDDLTTCSIW